MLPAVHVNWSTFFFFFGRIKIFMTIFCWEAKIKSSYSTAYSTYSYDQYLLSNDCNCINLNHSLSTFTPGAHIKYFLTPSYMSLAIGLETETWFLTDKPPVNPIKNTLLRFLTDCPMAWVHGSWKTSVIIQKIWVFDPWWEHVPPNAGQLDSTAQHWRSCLVSAA